MGFLKTLRVDDYQAARLRTTNMGSMMFAQNVFLIARMRMVQKSMDHLTTEGGVKVRESVFRKQDTHYNSSCNRLLLWKKPRVRSFFHPDFIIPFFAEAFFFDAIFFLLGNLCSHSSSSIVFSFSVCKRRLWIVWDEFSVLFSRRFERKSRRINLRQEACPSPSSYLMSFPSEDELRWFSSRIWIRQHENRVIQKKRSQT